MIALNGPHHKRYVVYNKKGKIIIITRNKNTARLFLNNANTKIAAAIFVLALFKNNLAVFLLRVIIIILPFLL